MVLSQPLSSGHSHPWHGHQDRFLVAHLAGGFPQCLLRILALLLEALTLQVWTIPRRVATNLSQGCMPLFEHIPEMASLYSSVLLVLYRHSCVPAVFESLQLGTSVEELSRHAICLNSHDFFHSYVRLPERTLW